MKVLGPAAEHCKEDTFEWLREHVRSLDDLHAVVAARRALNERAALTSNGKRWLVAGRYVLDGFGQLWVTTKPIPDPDLPPVIDMADVQRYLRRGESVSMSIEWVPTGRDACASCEVAFTLATAADAVRTPDAVTAGRTGTFRHRACAWIDAAKVNRKAFDHIFEEAGFRAFYLHDIGNGYWPGCGYEDPYYLPWFQAHTAVGQIRIGWRKRVIAIDWSSTGRDLAHLFVTEDVTKGPHDIHAWGYEKAIDYLRRVRVELEAIGRPPP